MQTITNRRSGLIEAVLVVMISLLAFVGVYWYQMIDSDADPDTTAHRTKVETGPEAHTSLRSIAQQPARSRASY
jgi:hypothetical protein